MAIYYVSATGTGGKNGSAPYDTGGANGPFIGTEAFGTGKTPVGGDTVYVINNGKYYFPSADLNVAATGTNIFPLRYVAVDTSLNPVDTRRGSGVLLDETKLAHLVLSSNTTLRVSDFAHLYGFYITTSGSTASKPAVLLNQSSLVGCKVVSTNTSSSSHCVTINGNNGILDNCDIFIPQTNNMTTAISATNPAFCRIHNCVVWNNSTTTGTSAISLGGYSVVSNSIIAGSKIGVNGSYGLGGYGYSVINSTFIGTIESCITYSAGNHAGLFHVSNNVLCSGANIINASNSTGWISAITSYNWYNMVDSTGTRAISAIDAQSYSTRLQYTGVFMSPTTTGLYLLPSTTGFGTSVFYGDTYGALPGLVNFRGVSIQ